MSNNCEALIEQFVETFAAQSRVVRSGEWCRLSVPIQTTGGHRVELAVSPLNPTSVLISDQGRTLSELINVGVDPFANSGRVERLEALEREFGLTRDAAELQVVSPVRELGSALIRFTTALKTISDLAYLHRVSTGASYRINLAIRSLLEREQIPFSEGADARVRGVLEPQHPLDFRGKVEDRAFGVAVLGGTGTKRLAEVWGFRFKDIHDADQTLRRIAVYDDEEQNWSQASVRILEGTSDLALPSSRVDALPTLLRAA